MPQGLWVVPSRWRRRRLWWEAPVLRRLMPWRRRWRRRDHPGIVLRTAREGETDLSFFFFPAYAHECVQCTTTLDCPPDGPGGRRYYSVHVQIRVQQSAKVPHMRTSTLSISTRPPPIRRPSGIGDSEPCQHTQRRWFHPTCRSEAAPLFLWLAGLLKVRFRVRLWCVG